MRSVLLACAALGAMGCRFNTAGLEPTDRSAAPIDRSQRESVFDFVASDSTSPPDLAQGDGVRPADVAKPGDLPKGTDRKIDKALVDTTPPDQPKVADKPKPDQPKPDQPKPDQPKPDQPKPKPDVKPDQSKPDRYTPWPCAGACPGQKCCWVNSSWTCYTQTIPDHCLCDPVSEEPCKSGGTNHSRCVTCKGAYQCWQFDLLQNCP